MIPLECPKCGKLLGKARNATASRFLLLWCKRCRMEVEPTVSRRAKGQDKD